MVWLKPAGSQPSAAPLTLQLPLFVQLWKMRVCVFFNKWCSDVLVRGCEGEVRGKAPACRNVCTSFSQISERTKMRTRGSLTILSGGGLLPTRHSNLPLECLTACCVASAVMMGGPRAMKKKQAGSVQGMNKRQHINYYHADQYHIFRNHFKSMQPKRKLLVNKYI